ncbi:calsequestrin-1-like [Mizuhopecten yessoensis]|uniref:calsequestrin-1-like n=1 Tax=Mizuhopecten yessoensis TaxID=6573 RepID=UPI000B45BC09|nr:calsequestrin-1-like [Mizuhopecten yessoensis]
MSVQPHIQETPPDYEEVVAEEQASNLRRQKPSDNVNVAYEPDIDRIEVAIEAEEGDKEGRHTEKTAAATASVTPPTVTSVEKVSDSRAVEPLTPQEEKMLSVLRDVAQKCTNANPLKRPSAEQVLKMLQVINPYPDDYDEDADDDEDDDVEVKYKVSDDYDTKNTSEITLSSS